MGFSILPRNRLCSIMIFRFPVGFRGLSPYSYSGILFHHHSHFSLHSFPRKGFLFHHDFLVPSGSGKGAGACLPTFFSFLCPFRHDFFSWFQLGFRGSVPLSFAGSSWFRLGFRRFLLSFFLVSCQKKGVLFHHDFLVPPGAVLGSGACLPSSLLFLFSGNRRPMNF